MLGVIIIGVMGGGGKTTGSLLSLSTLGIKSAVSDDVKITMGDPISIDRNYQFQVPSQPLSSNDVYSIEGTLNYVTQFDCTQSTFTNRRVVPGDVELYDQNQLIRVLKFNAVEGISTGSVFIGDLTGIDEIKVKTYKTNECQMKDFQYELVSQEVTPAELTNWQELVQLHAPFLGLRADQWGNNLTDLPLAMAYQIINGNGQNKVAKTIRYTVYFTDEDSLTKTDELSGQLGRYGRRADIEWCYEIDFDANYQPIQRRYQGSLFNGVGHRTKLFRGKFLPGGRHPVLYVATLNNVFDDSPHGKQGQPPLVGVQMVPDYEIQYPNAREWYLFEHPWFFSVSDREQASEQKLTGWSHDQLYVMVEGELNKGSFNLRLTTQSGDAYVGGNGQSSVDRLGQDAWGRQSFTAIPLGEALVTDLVHANLKGEVSFVMNGTNNYRDLDVSSAIPGKEPMRFFVLKGSPDAYQVEEVTSLFSCKYQGYKTLCRF